MWCRWAVELWPTIIVSSVSPSPRINSRHTPADPQVARRSHRLSKHTVYRPLGLLVETNCKHGENETTAGNCAVLEDYLVPNIKLVRYYSQNDSK